MKQTYSGAKEEYIDPHEGEYFIVMCLIHLKRLNTFERFFCEVYSLNETTIINKFSKKNKQYVNELPKIMTLTKFSYEQFYEFSVNEFGKMFPYNLKVFLFKASNGKTFSRKKLINNSDHEMFYLRKMESEGFKCIGNENFNFRHKLYNK